MVKGESAPAVPTVEPSPARPTAAPPESSPIPSPNGPPAAATPTPAPTVALPAETLLAPSRRARVLWYAGTAVLTSLLLFAGLRLDQATLTAPLEYRLDVLLIMPLVKTTLERGSHWRNERVGFPGIQELHDFPVVDHLHFAILWLIGRVVSDFVVVFNVYYLLTWPLTALTAMYAFRRLGLTLPAAAAGAILYAFLPYHFLRGQPHYFLAAYWLVPLTWLPALELCRGNLPFFHREADDRYRLSLRRWCTLWQLLLAAATASAGAYYAFFACAIYCTAGVYGWIVHRTWKAAAAGAILAAAIVAFGIVNHLPAIRHALKHERNSATVRYPEEAETYGLKIAQLLLPVDGHRVLYLSRIKSRYDGVDRPLNNENGSATLGVVGSVGFLILVAGLLYPARRGWPYGPLIFLSGCIVIFATVGGLSSVFNLLVFDQVRCVNRISVYLAFLCQFAALWPLDRFLLSRTGWARRLRYLAFVVLVALGVSDQTPFAWYGQIVVDMTRKDQDRFRADREFFTRVEDLLSTGPRNPLDPDAPPRVFTLPYVQFPEVPPVNELEAYEHARGYLHTSGVVWSFGAMKHREADAWLHEVSYEPAHNLIRRVAARGFDGIFVDGHGFVNQTEANRFIHALKSAAAPTRLTEVVHTNGREVFLDLRAYRDWLWHLDGGKSFETWVREERDWVAVTWLRGFFRGDPNGRHDSVRFGYESAMAVIVNPGETRRFTFKATFGVDATGEFRLAIDGGGITQLNREDGPGSWRDEFSVEHIESDRDSSKRRQGVTKTYVIEVPPGRHTVRFKCQVPPTFLPDSPPLCYFIKDFKLTPAR